MGNKKGKNKNQSIILDRFSDADIRTWNRASKLSEQYNVKLFYHLESLRQIHHQDLCEALQDTSPLTLKSENWWRFVDLKYTDIPLSAHGSIIKGARFNIGNDLGSIGFKPFPVLYFAENEDTAKAEKFGTTKAANGLENNELALRTTPSYSAMRLKFEIHNVFDLTKANNLLKFTQIISTFQISDDLRKLATELGHKPPYLVSKPSQLKEVLLSNNWRYYPVQHEIPANSQLFGRILRDAGFDAVIYPSTKNPKYKNIGVFIENLEKSSSFVELQDEASSQVKITKLSTDTWKELT